MRRPKRKWLKIAESLELISKLKIQEIKDDQSSMAWNLFTTYPNPQQLEVALQEAHQLAVSSICKYGDEFVEVPVHRLAQALICDQEPDRAAIIAVAAVIAGDQVFNNYPGVKYGQDHYEKAESLLATLSACTKKKQAWVTTSYDRLGHVETIYINPKPQMTICCDLMVYSAKRIEDEVWKNGWVIGPRLEVCNSGVKIGWMDAVYDGSPERALSELFQKAQRLAAELYPAAVRQIKEIKKELDTSNARICELEAKNLELEVRLLLAEGATIRWKKTYDSRDGSGQSYASWSEVYSLQAVMPDQTIVREFGKEVQDPSYYTIDKTAERVAKIVRAVNQEKEQKQAAV